MVNCSYCQKEIERLIFCSPSHKVLYHRKFTKGKQLTNGKHIDSPKEVQKVLEEKGLKLCKHGAKKGLCRFGC